ncbi:rhodanese-like domain-containing protein [Chryseobacterium sp. RP-3-3]|uniref:Rhodanese-like domain-containing protein n=1 Tax=Chryseobacterium antibioticum TaxID=2728847 RepID=A0A7Y0FQ23_9FLAO|nr:rhodanese-like domain-containing protein [Chryseobacterium antibioticum]NML68563.1 rhodanese-like domain-containing protein [Chryseobacterium antibioticum]
MKYLLMMAFLVSSMFSQFSAQQKQDPWNDSQLMDPAFLAARITENKTKNMVIISVGPEAIIKGSVDIGPTHEPENLEKLRNYLKNIPKGKEVVIYCGCCPFVKCPNIRPAFKLLQEMGFRNVKLLNLPKNIKVDWLDKDYPTND